MYILLNFPNNKSQLYETIKCRLIVKNHIFTINQKIWIFSIVQNPIINIVKSIICNYLQIVFFLILELIDNDEELIEFEFD